MLQKIACDYMHHLQQSVARSGHIQSLQINVATAAVCVAGQAAYGVYRNTAVLHKKLEHAIEHERYVIVVARLRAYVVSRKKCSKH